MRTNEVIKSCVCVHYYQMEERERKIGALRCADVNARRIFPEICDKRR